MTTEDAGLADEDRPIGLPHLEIEADGCRFLGEPLDPELFDADSIELWEDCDGRRSVHEYGAEHRRRLRRWYRAGLVLADRPRPRLIAEPLTVISPHPDDAPLALGAALAAGGGRIVDVFSHETWTRRTHYRRAPQRTAELLLAEERLACRLLGVRLSLLGESDADLRDAARDRLFVDPVEDDPAVEEPELFRRLVTSIGRVLDEVSGSLAVPLAIGGHRDHVLTRDATLAALAARARPTITVEFYEDMPYRVFARTRSDPEGLADRIGLGKLSPRDRVADALAARTKAEALRAYRLQVPTGVVKRVMAYGQDSATARFTEHLRTGDRPGFSRAAS